jgi:hypothetical protein
MPGDQRKHLKAPRSIKISSTLMERILELPSTGMQHHRIWSKEEDEALLAGRRKMKSWGGICSVLGVHEQTARKRFKELTDKPE